MKFEPGKSGNPGGRPKDELGLRALARQHGPDAIKTLAALMLGAKVPAAARVAACKELLERGYGKVTQPISGDDDAPALQVLVRRIVEVQSGGG